MFLLNNKYMENMYANINNNTFKEIDNNFTCDHHLLNNIIK